MKFYGETHKNLNNEYVNIYKVDEDGILYWLNEQGQWSYNFRLGEEERPPFNPNFHLLEFDSKPVFSHPDDLLYWPRIRAQMTRLGKLILG